MSLLPFRSKPMLSLTLLVALGAPAGLAQDAKKDGNVPDNKPTVEKPDHSAEAYVVEESIDRWDFQNDGTGSRVETFRVRIQSDAGVQNFGVLTLAYQKATETLTIDYVRVKKPDGTTVVTPLDDVQDMPAEVTREAPFYSDLREKHVAVKGLSVGDVLETSCRWATTKPLVPGQFWMSLDFSDEVALSEKLQVSVPRDRQVKVKNSPFAPAVSEEGGRRIYTWTRSNVEREFKQPDFTERMKANLGTLPSADIQLTSFRSWEELGRWYEDLQRDRIVVSPEIRAKAAELTRNAPDEAAKILAIYKYVSAEVHYIGVDFGVGRYQPHFATEVLSNQYGDCKDKHTLLASLLAAAGIPSFPALINTAHVVDSDVPLPSQFNHVITVVPQGKELLWLDTTLEVAPLGFLPAALRDKQALVVFPDKPPSFRTTPANPPFPTSYVFKIDSKLDESGTLQGKVELTMRGDLELIWRNALRRTPRAQWRDVVQQISYALGFGGDVSDITASMPEATETPLHFTYTYKRKDYPDWKNHRISPPAPIVLLAPSEKDGKLPEKYWLGAPGEFQFEARIELPKGFTPDLPPNRDFKEEFAEYHSTYDLEGSVLVARYRVVLKSAFVSGPAVNDYNTFAKRVHEDRDQFIVAASGKPESPEQVMLALRQRVWQLPDSKDPQAMQAEQDSQTAFEQRSAQGVIDALKRAVRLDPKFARAWIILGQMHIAMMDRDSAIEAFRKAVAAEPKEPVCYKMLAMALESLGKRSEAIQVWQDLAKAVPGERDVPGILGSLLVAEKRYLEAVPYLESAIQNNPKNGSPFAVGLAVAYLRSGDDEKATAAFAKALEMDPGAQAKNNVAYELANAGKRLDDALRYAQEAVSMEEDASRKVQFQNMAIADLEHTVNLGAYWDTLGWVHFSRGNFKQAEGYLYAAWLLVQDPVTGLHLARTYEAEQRKAEAGHMYQLVAGLHTTRGSEAVEAIAEAQKHAPPIRTTITSKRGFFPLTVGSDEQLGKDRTTVLPRLVTKATAEYFIFFGPGPKVEDTQFISGSEELRSAAKTLAEAHYKVAFPENSSARLVRRGILGCFPNTGCSFVLMPIENVRSVD